MTDKNMKKTAGYKILFELFCLTICHCTLWNSLSTDKNSLQMNACIYFLLYKSTRKSLDTTDLEEERRLLRGPITFVFVLCASPAPHGTLL